MYIQEKYYLLKKPAYREEIDYLIKDMQRVQEQLCFSNFEFMLASKICMKGNSYTETGLFERIKNMVVQNNIPEKLKEWKRKQPPKEKRPG